MEGDGRAVTHAFCLLFDLDGTMVDTDRLHLAAWNEVLARRGRPPVDHDFYRTRVMGFAKREVAEALFPNCTDAEVDTITDLKESLFRASLDRLEPTRGLPELLARAEAKEWGLAVVTNAPRANALAMLGGLGWAGRFPVLVIGDELPRGKPDPLPYRTALERLGGRPDRALAFEDSGAGVRAAAGAGVTTIGILGGLTETELRAAGAAFAVADFDDPCVAAALPHAQGKKRSTATTRQA